MLLWFLLGTLLALGRDRLRLMRGWAVAVVLVVCIATILSASGCGGGSSGPPPPSGTPAGTYNLTVTGTSQGQNRTVGLTLTVN